VSSGRLPARLLALLTYPWPGTQEQGQALPSCTLSCVCVCVCVCVCARARALFMIDVASAQQLSCVDEVSLR
jgi:hypothetical protein